MHGRQSSRREALAALAAACLIPACASRRAAGPRVAHRDPLDTAGAAARWIETQRTPSGAWRTAAGLDDTNPSLYNGAAGILYSLLELHAAAPDPRLDASIRSGASYLASTIDERPDGYGLYTGLAGAAWVLHRCSIVHPHVRPHADRAAALLLAGARETEWGVEWSDQLDIISGGAGILLACLAIHDLTADERFLETAWRAGDRLCQLAIDAPNGVKWPHETGATREMPNFSHGTAGVAYALATLATRTGESAHFDNAAGGVDYLRGIANTDNGFRVFYDNLTDPPIDYMGWCHGPVGTSRLFLRYQELDNVSGWDRTAADCAAAVMNSGIDRHPTPGFWNNLGICCGNAGVAMFFLRLARRTGRRDLADYARAHAAIIDSHAVRDDTGCRWTFAEHRRRPTELSTQTGLMQGAAGIGLLHLALAAYDRGADLPTPLPDDPG